MRLSPLFFSPFGIPRSCYINRDPEFKPIFSTYRQRSHIHVRHCLCHHPCWQYVNIGLNSGVWWSSSFFVRYLFLFQVNLAVTGSFSIFLSYRNEHCGFHQFPFQRLDKWLGKGDLDPRHGCRGLPCSWTINRQVSRSTLVIYQCFPLIWASEGIQGEARRYVAPWV